MQVDIRDNISIESFYQGFSEPEGYGAFDEDQNTEIIETENEDN